MQAYHSFGPALPRSRFISFQVKRSFTTTLLWFLAASLLCSVVAPAKDNRRTSSVLTINPTVGPPTTNILVSGTGFDPYAQVDIYFDTTGKATAVTDGAGAFGGGIMRAGILVKVPTSAHPGHHWITAMERSWTKTTQTSFLVRTDWPQLQFDVGHAGFNPYENVLSPATVGGISLLWNFATAYGGTPAVANGVAYYASDALYALDAGTGTFLWKYQTGVDFYGAAVASGMVYFATDDGSFAAVNASTGTLVWRYQPGSEGAYIPTRR